ncbi:MAG: transketolase [Thermodesulfobacteriota bacterium]|nr:transketolase [Thermodesulfobacteriota bacterium]
MTLLNTNLRRKIVDMVVKGRDGHIPSAFSIVDIVSLLYKKILKFDAGNPEWNDRDYFILSKGHGCLALYVVLEQHGFLSKKDINDFCTPEGILGEHPDCTRVPGVEASTGSLGHGLPFSVGIALGLRVRNQNNRVIILVGDGECHEGTVWESANVANNLQLGNMCVIVDWNESATQLMPRDDLPEKWKAFGWNVEIIDGHSEESIEKAVSNVTFSLTGQPSVILAKTVKGKGVPMLEGHGPWHHRIPDKEEYTKIMEALL